MRIFFISLLLTFFSHIYTAEQAQAGILQYKPSGSYRILKAPGPISDPITAPSVESLGITKKKLPRNAPERITAELVDRIESHYAADVDSTVVTWLQNHPKIRSEFWLALDPTYDHPAEAIEMLGKLIKHNEERVIQFAHLAIAIALVHDNEHAATNSQYYLIWGIGSSQYQSVPQPLEIFDYYTDPSMKKVTAVPLNKLVWPLLIHLADLDLNQSECDWTRNKYTSGKGDLANTYSDVPYDYNKLNRTSTALGSRPYTMANILRYGGVCVDQAHFSSRAMKALGTPAIKVRGDGRFGGAGHAWTGYLTATKRSASFAFTGRYNIDNYYIGEVLDPQRSIITTDRSMALDLSAALYNYHTFVQSRALIRVAESLFETNKEASWLLTQHSLESNPLVKEAWDHLIEHVIAETIDLKSAGKWMNKMVQQGADHPDFVWDIIGKFLNQVPEDDWKVRNALYKHTLSILKERPDLQIALRRRQCSELYAADKANQATSLAVNTLVQQAQEGALILPLLRVVIDDAKVRPEKERQAIRTHLEKMAAQFPEKRGDTVSAAWTAMKELLSTL